MISNKEYIKLKPVGMTQIWKVISYTMDGTPMFYNCKIQFKNEESAKLFVHSSPNNVINLVTDMESDAVLRLELPFTNTFFGVEKGSIFSGKYILNIFKKYCNTEGVKELFTDNYGKPIEINSLPEEFSLQLK